MLRLNPVPRSSEIAGLHIRILGSHGYMYRTMHHLISFVNPDTEDHTNTIECTWCHVKAFLGPYHRQKDYEFHLAHYMFVVRCKAQGVSQFTQFLPSPHPLTGPPAHHLSPLGLTPCDLQLFVPGRQWTLATQVCARSHLSLCQ